MMYSRVHPPPSFVGRMYGPEDLTPATDFSQLQPVGSGSMQPTPVRSSQAAQMQQQRHTQAYPPPVQPQRYAPPGVPPPAWPHQSRSAFPSRLHAQTQRTMAPTRTQQVTTHAPVGAVSGWMGGAAAPLPRGGVASTTSAAATPHRAMSSQSGDTTMTTRPRQGNFIPAASVIASGSNTIGGASSFAPASADPGSVSVGVVAPRPSVPIPIAPAAPRSGAYFLQTRAGSFVTVVRELPSRLVHVHDTPSSDIVFFTFDVLCEQAIATATARSGPPAAQAARVFEVHIRADQAFLVFDTPVTGGAGSASRSTDTCLMLSATPQRLQMVVLPPQSRERTTSTGDAPAAIVAFKMPRTGKYMSARPDNGAITYGVSTIGAAEKFRLWPVDAIDMPISSTMRIDPAATLPTEYKGWRWRDGSGVAGADGHGWWHFQPQEWAAAPVGALHARERAADGTAMTYITDILEYGRERDLTQLDMIKQADEFDRPQVDTMRTRTCRGAGRREWSSSACSPPLGVLLQSSSPAAFPLRLRSHSDARKYLWHTDLSSSSPLVDPTHTFGVTSVLGVTDLRGKLMAPKLRLSSSRAHHIIGTERAVVLSQHDRTHRVHSVFAHQRPYAAGIEFDSRSTPSESRPQRATAPDEDDDSTSEAAEAQRRATQMMRQLDAAVTSRLHSFLPIDAALDDLPSSPCVLPITHDAAWAEWLRTYCAPPPVHFAHLQGATVTRHDAAADDVLLPRILKQADIDIIKDGFKPARITH